MKKLTSLMFLTLIWLGSLTYAERLNGEAVPVESLEPLVIDKEKLSAFEYAPIVELEE